MKPIYLFFAGMALMLALVLGWNRLDEAVAVDQPVKEIWAVYGTPFWDTFEGELSTAYLNGYELKGYAVTQNSKGTMVKFAILSRRE